MTEMCHDPLAGAPEAERTAGRLIARARNQRGVVPMRLTHAPGKQSGRTLVSFPDPTWAGRSGNETSRKLGRSKSRLRD